MYKKILVPLDGSGAAQIVLPYVAEIAAKLGSEIILVSVSERAGAETDHLYRSYLEHTEEQVQSELKSWGAKGEVKVRSEVLLGRPDTEILRYADVNNVELIAMASRGSSGRGPWLLGHIAAKVLRATTKPVLLVRTLDTGAVIQKKGLMKKILLPLDGSEAGKTAIPHAEVLAQTLGAEMILFHVIEPIIVSLGGPEQSIVPIPQDEKGRESSAMAYLNSVGKELREKGLSTSSVIALGSAANQIIDYAEENAINLIAMSTHGRSGIGRWVFGSVTDKVLHAGDTAVLLVPAAKTIRIR